MLSVAAIAAADVASGVLAVAGAAKIRRPAPFATFLRTTGIGLTARRADGVARMVGVGEIAVATTALLVGGTAPFAVLGAFMVALAAVSFFSVSRRAPSCGCFGAASAPTTSTHVVLDLLFARGALGAAMAGAAPIVDRLGPAPTGATYVLLVGLGTALAVVSMTTAADLASVRRSLVPLPAAERPRR
jgi:hypothetical protein